MTGCVLSGIKIKACLPWIYDGMASISPYPKSMILYELLLRQIY